MTFLIAGSFLPWWHWIRYETNRMGAHFLLFMFISCWWRRRFSALMGCRPWETTPATRVAAVKKPSPFNSSTTGNNWIVFPSEREKKSVHTLSENVFFLTRSLVVISASLPWRPESWRIYFESLAPPQPNERVENGCSLFYLINIEQFLLLRQQTTRAEVHHVGSRPSNLLKTPYLIKMFLHFFLYRWLHYTTNFQWQEPKAIRKERTAS